MLTSKQKQTLQFLTSYIDEHNGLSPSFEEMVTGLGLHSKSGVHRLICSLEGRGYIRRIPYLARSIEVIRNPGETLPPDTVLEVPDAFAIYGFSLGECIRILKFLRSRGLSIYTLSRLFGLSQIETFTFIEEERPPFPRAVSGGS